jgi:putative spermidine/putrescine transport system substrate-binding protein
MSAGATGSRTIAARKNIGAGKATAEQQEHSRRNTMAKRLIGKKPKQASDLITRRSLLQGAGATAAALAAGPIISTEGKAQASAVVRFADDGGFYGDAREEAFLKPFSKETGVEVRRYIGQKDLSKMKAMQVAGNLEFDVVCDQGGPVEAAGLAGYLVPLDKSKLDLTNYMQPQWATEHAIAFQYYLLGMGYHAEAHKGKPLPTSWAEYWDVKAFPGRRAMLSRPSDTMEVALLADGVAPAKLYPLDVDRAYASLDKLKPSVQVWMDDSAKSIELLQRQEVDYAFTSSGRIEASQAAGVPLRFLYEFPFAGPQDLGILKGTTQADHCMTLINRFVSNPDSGAAYFNKAVGFGPLDRPTLDRLPEALKAKLPNPDNPKVAWGMPSWWGQHLGEVAPRHKLWLMQ